jgi:hypothetical protein
MCILEIEWPGLMTHSLFLSDARRLREQEARLERITAEQGSNVNEFVGLVKENKEILVKQQVRSVSCHAGDQCQACLVLSDSPTDDSLLCISIIHLLGCSRISRIRFFGRTRMTMEYLPTRKSCLCSIDISRVCYTTMLMSLP